ncbi:uncharacterized protein LOC109727564 isoform X3 [Ananas comosus]|uniref:Uncharacterized protein LOC109727564 isoform X3 n=1 Tax=Ananas comosus TaxID=4615 RepID=A0A6P5HBE3_ANACO|nr:uncharacterized protein LOC109727564 isoform X3 [Ananas comosus]
MSFITLKDVICQLMILNLTTLRHIIQLACMFSLIWSTDDIKFDYTKARKMLSWSTDDIKFDYTKAYNPVGVLLQFPSESSFDTAVKQTIRRGRLYKIEKIDRSEWDLKTSYDGKVVLLQGIPRNAVQEDVERFLSGSNFELSTFQMLFRQGFPDPVRIALVHFPTRLDAMNAFCFNNRGFCLNSPVSMRVLH